MYYRQRKSESETHLVHVGSWCSTEAQPRWVCTLCSYFLSFIVRPCTFTHTHAHTHTHTHTPPHTPTHTHTHTHSLQGAGNRTVPLLWRRQLPAPLGEEHWFPNRLFLAAKCRDSLTHTHTQGPRAFKGTIYILCVRVLVVRVVNHRSTNMHKYKEVVTSRKRS